MDDALEVHVKAVGPAVTCVAKQAAVRQAIAITEDAPAKAQELHEPKRGAHSKKSELQPVSLDKVPGQPAACCCQEQAGEETRPHRPAGVRTPPQVGFLFLDHGSSRSRASAALAASSLDMLPSRQRARSSRRSFRPAAWTRSKRSANSS